MLNIFNFTYTVIILFEKFEKLFYLHYLFQTKLSNIAKCAALKLTPSDQTAANASLLESTTPGIYEVDGMFSRNIILRKA